MAGCDTRKHAGSPSWWQVVYVLLPALIACPSNVPATEILLVVHSNLQVGTELNAVHVEIYDSDAAKSLKARTLKLGTKASKDRYELPLSLSIAPASQSSTQTIRVVVTGRGPKTQGGPDQDIIEQQVITYFEPDSRLRLDVFLGSSCFDKLCHDASNNLTDQSCDLVSQRCAAVPTRDSLPEAEGDGITQFMLPDGVSWDAGATSDSAVDGGKTNGVACQSGYHRNGSGTCVADNGSDAGNVTCDAGYSDDGTGTCVDTNECKQGTDDCSDLATCNNVDGSYACTCDSGFTGSGHGTGGCTDIDECDADPSPCANGPCNNKPGSYACGDCVAGYGPNSAGTCVDLDECKQGTDDCNNFATCSNVDGSYTCNCISGYTGSGHGNGGCTDVNECNTSNGGCDSNATCENTPGSRTCTCNSGYSGSGTTCDDDNECSDNTDDCDNSPTATCTNTAGSYTCGCPSGTSGTGHGSSGCICDPVTECDDASEMSGSYCVDSSNLNTCQNNGVGCQQVALTACTGGQECVGVHPNARCASETSYGYPTPGSSSETWFSYMVGISVQVDQPASFRRFGVVWAGNGAGGNQSRLLTFALYAGDASGPSGSPIATVLDRSVNTVGSAYEFYPMNGINASLSAGYYWIFVNINSAGFIAALSDPSTPYLYKAVTYGAAIPDPAPSDFLSSSFTGPPNMYIVTLPQQ